MDEEEAAKRYNKKHQLKNSLFDNLLRKGKNWSHANKLPYDKNESVPLDLYEPEIIDSEDDNVYDMGY